MRTVRLGEVADLIRGVSFDGGEALQTKTTDHTPILRAGNIQNELDTEKDLVWVPARCVSPEQQMKVGDIAVCMSSGSASVVGKSALLRVDFEGAVGAFCAIVRPTAIDASYLALWFRSPAFWEWRDGQARGASIQNLRLSQLSQLEILGPSIADQHRIAAMTGSHLLGVENLRESVLDRSREVALLREREIRTALAGLWPSRRLEEVLSIQTGFAFESACFRPTGVRLLRNANIQHDHIDWRDAARLDTALEPGFESFRLSEGDIVLSLDRPVVSGGLKVARLGLADVPSLLLQRVARFRLGPAIDAEYLFAFLRSSAFLDAMSGHDQSLGVPHVSPRQVAAVEIPLPAIDEQRRIAAELRERLATIDAMTRAIDAQLEAIDALPAALLRRAFADIEAA